MIYTTRQGQVSGGEAIGILLLDTSVPFIPGDVANATTYDFPVRFHKVKGFSVSLAIGKDPSVFDALEAAARDVVSQGVRAVTGDCGYMAVHQKRLADALGVPVFLSSLLQIPFILATLGKSSKVGVLTADSRSLNHAMLESLDIKESGRVAIAGLQDREQFCRFALEETGDLDATAVEKELVSAARDLVRQNPAVRTLLLECSLLPPYAAAVQAAVGLPVYDYVTMINFVFSAVVKRPFRGFQ